MLNTSNNFSLDVAKVRARQEKLFGRPRDDIGRGDAVPPPALLLSLSPTKSELYAWHCSCYLLFQAVNQRENFPRATQDLVS
jgi:hypothetical protein